MGVRDALLHNVTGSNFEALQSGDTARIKGDFSIKNTSRTEIFGVDVSAATVNVTGNVTSSMDISGSSTGSFGRFVASSFIHINICNITFFRLSRKRYWSADCTATIWY